MTSLPIEHTGKKISPRDGPIALESFSDWHGLQKPFGRQSWQRHAGELSFHVPCMAFIRKLPKAVNTLTQPIKTYVSDHFIGLLKLSLKISGTFCGAGIFRSPQNYGSYYIILLIIGDSIANPDFGEEACLRARDGP